jgi:hypothetical protein
MDTTIPTERTTTVFVVLHEDAHETYVSSAHRSHAGAEAAMRGYVADVWSACAERDPSLPPEPPADLRKAVELLAEAGCCYSIESVELSD